MKGCGGTCALVPVVLLAVFGQKTKPKIQVICSYNF